jgi:hypothetical protein
MMLERTLRKRQFNTIYFSVGMKALPDNRTVAERYAADFIKRLRLDDKAEQRCEWSCILWSKDHWAEQARKVKIDLHQAKERISASTHSEKETDTLFTNSQFMNTVAQIYSKLFEVEEKSCAVKEFPNCPFMNQRQDLLNRGSLANVFVTILHKATFYAMLDRHPLDSGLFDEEYKDVYGIDLTDFQDLEHSLTDRRFEKLYGTVVKRASELTDLRSA